MATDRRVARVAELIKREISQLLTVGIKDDRVGAGMVSITDVELSRDLQHAKVFVSIYGDEAAQAETLEGLQAATRFVRREISQRLNLRRSPVVVFQQDPSLERGTRVLSLINQLQRQREAAEQTDLSDPSDLTHEPRERTDPPPSSPVR